MQPMMASLRRLALLTLLIIPACGGGGDSSLRPVISGIAPTGVVGITGTSATFTATVGNTVAGSTYTWSFGGGATPNASSAVSPNVTLGGSGSYNGSLVVCNPDGCSPAFPFSFTVADPTDPPVISAVTPTEGFVGEVVEFTAVASNAPSGWSWNFGGAGTPNTSSSAKPVVTLGAQGSYGGTVTATNVAGSSVAFDFTIVVNEPTAAPTVTSVTPSGTAGESGDRATFRGTASQGPTGWSWTFGGGATPNTSSLFQPTVQLERPGSYTGTVVATNGLGASSAFNFDYSVDLPTLPIWSQHQVDSSQNSAQGGYDLFLLDGRPLVAYKKSSNRGLTIARGKTAKPLRETDWEVYEIDPGTGFEAGFNPSIAIVNGRLAISHVRVRAGSLDEPALMYSRANVDSPTSGSSWVTSLVVQEPMGATKLVGLPSGFPAIGYTGPLQRPKVATANTTTPGSSGDWKPHFIAAAAFNDPMDIAVVDGLLQVVFGGASGLRHLRTTDSLPDNASDWTIHAPIPTLATAQAPRIIDGGGFPVIALGSDNREAFSTLLVARGTKAQPVAESDWITMVANSTQRTGIGIGLTLVDNRVVVSYYEAVASGSLYELQVVRALTSQPELDTDWQRGVVVRSTSLTPAQTRVAAVDGTIRILGTIQPSTRINIFQAESVW
ncbi:MAG: hypothetical protein GEEBNDBF_01726 [bacterium]|nr:hypothetical protein [bacterium]